MHTVNISVPQFTTVFRETHLVVTLEVISGVLRIPRVAHPDYLGCTRLGSLSWDELASCFYKCCGCSSFLLKKWEYASAEWIVAEKRWNREP